MAALLKLKAKQAIFCNMVVTVSTHTVCDLDSMAPFFLAEGTSSLWSLLKQVSHPTTNTCRFFQAIDNYSVCMEVVSTMLPSMVAYGSNAILGLIPFTCLAVVSMSQVWLVWCTKMVIQLIQNTTFRLDIVPICTSTVHTCMTELSRTRRAQAEGSSRITIIISNKGSNSLVMSPGIA